MRLLRNSPLSESRGAGDTAPRVKTLTTRTVASFGWAFSGAATQAVLKIVVLAVLARLLTPEDFGTITAALTVVALAELFTQIGVAPSVVQAPILTESHIRTAFTLTLIMGIVAATATLLAAPIIARQLGMPDIENVIRVLSVVFLVRGLSSVAESYLQRQMRFRALSINMVLSYLFGYAIVSIVAAAMGLGIWALVAGNVVQALLSSAGFLVQARLPLRLQLDRSVLGQLIRFGFGLTLARIGNYVATNIDYIIVGRTLGPAALGFYSRAYLLLMQPAQLFGSISDKVLFPAMSSIQTDRTRFNQAFYRSVGLVALATLPISAFIVIFAPEIIEILLGPNWSEIVPAFQILMGFLFFRTGYKIVTTVLRARGSVYSLAIWQWIYGGLIAAGAFFGHFGGLEGVAIGISLAIFLSFWLGLAIAQNRIGVSLVTVLVVVGRNLLIGLAVALLALAIRAGFASAGVNAFIGLGVGGVAAALLLGVLFLAVPTVFGDEGLWLRQLVIRRLRHGAANHAPKA
jgi:O-antigen/teichoic acid export membrane protein